MHLSPISFTLVHARSKHLWTYDHKNPMKMTEEKATVNITINGGNNQILPNATHAEQHFHEVGKVENNYTTTIEIHLNATINLNGEVLARFCTKLTQRLPIAFCKFLQGHFDGEGDISLTTYQLSGAPSDIAEALRLLRRELGDDATADVRYHSKTTRFERNHLTLLSAEQIADDESRL